MKNYNPADHVNYTHLVGEVVGLEFKVRPDKSNFCLCQLEVATEHKGKKHEPDVFQLIFWDRLANALYNEALVVRDDEVDGDILSVEGRLTIRGDKYSVTGNRVKILRQISNKEPFLQEITKEPEE